MIFVQQIFDPNWRYLLDLISPGSSVLDIGCNIGLTSDFLSLNGRSVTGVDRDEQAIDYARKNSRGNPVFIHQKFNFFSCLSDDGLRGFDYALLLKLPLFYKKDPLPGGLFSENWLFRKRLARLFFRNIIFQLPRDDDKLGVFQDEDYEEGVSRMMKELGASKRIKDFVLVKLK